MYVAGVHLAIEKNGRQMVHTIANEPWFYMSFLGKNTP
jgi:hypothetical protein